MIKKKPHSLKSFGENKFPLLVFLDKFCFYFWFRFPALEAASGRERNQLVLALGKVTAKAIFLQKVD